MIAFITGATEGIGYEFSRIFASKGNDLILVARNGEKLKSIASDLAEKYKVKVDYYAEDLSILSNAGHIVEELHNKKIIPDYVINNAGYGNSGDWTDVDWETELNMINLNVITLSYFTKVFAREMKQRGSGKILNIGSIASLMPVPYMSTYGATKAFVLSLSNAIDYELKGSGVTVTVLCPGVTSSQFHKRAKTVNTLQKSKFLVQSSPSSTAEYGYRIMMRGKSTGIHRFANKTLIFLMRFVPRSISTAVSSRTTK